MLNRPKLIRITTVPISLAKLLERQLHFMQQHYEVTAISADVAELQNVGKKEGINVFPVELTRKITPLKDLLALWTLYSYFKKEKPLIVHSHTPKAGTLGMIAAKLAGVPYRLHTVAGLPLLETTGVKRKLLNVVEKITYLCATKIYPNSNGLKQIIIEQNLCGVHKLDVLANGSSNGIDTGHFNKANFSIAENNILKAELQILPTDFVYIFVGRLVGDKGINELVSAFEKISRKNNSVKLLLVGSFENDLDPLEAATINLINQNKNIIFVGFQPDVRHYFAISDALVFPSYREGFPNVVMQAGAMGLPSIVSNINGCNEIIIEGENGTIISTKDANALQQAMEDFINNKPYLLTLKDNARRMIEERYEQSMVWNALLNEYNFLLKQKK